MRSKLMRQYFVAFDTCCMKASGTQSYWKMMEIITDQIGADCNKNNSTRYVPMLKTRYTVTVPSVLQITTFVSASALREPSDIFRDAFQKHTSSKLSTESSDFWVRNRVKSRSFSTANFLPFGEKTKNHCPSTKPKDLSLWLVFNSILRQIAKRKKVIIWKFMPQEECLAISLHSFLMQENTQRWAFWKVPISFYKLEGFRNWCISGISQRHIEQLQRFL